MTSTSTSAIAAAASDPPAGPRPAALPAALAAGLAALALLPRISGVPRLAWTLWLIAGALGLWLAVVVTWARRNARVLAIERVVVRAHYVQACVQFSILVWWGWFAPAVYRQWPLVLAQLLFLYVFDALLSWTRGRPWRVGFGPLPIIFSTNLLLWFKDEWFFLQFAMITIGVLGKQFLTWQREGRRTHVFNPSAFGQSVIAVALIATGTTNALTWGREIATSFETPHMLFVIFLGGLVVQYLFRVTLMTLAAAATLVLINLAYTQATGVYFFVNINVAAPVFLGLHLLVTDPATSPRTNVGKIAYGVLYALGYALLFRLFSLYEVPTFWDKLLPVPVLNLCVPLIDRLAGRGLVGRWNARWESALAPRALHLAHMGVWVALFAGMWATGFVEAAHPGASVAFWKNAYAEGKPHAGHSLVMAAGAQAEGLGSAAAFNELGLISIEGRIVDRSPGGAARYFGRACELGSLEGCANVAVQYLFLKQRRSQEDVTRALDRLEAACSERSGACFLAGAAYERGRGRPQDTARAIELYQRAGADSPYARKGLVRIGLSGADARPVTEAGVRQLEASCASGDAEDCWYLAYAYDSGNGVRPDPAQARQAMERACGRGLAPACALAKAASFPPFEPPVMAAPGWSTAFPLRAPSGP
ncbi:MAG: hypothetical protein ABW221_22950 [Vicinamibacteria bacterium]